VPHSPTVGLLLLYWVLAKRWEEPAIKLAVAGMFKSRWHVAGMVDPRQAPSQGVSMCTHHVWVYPLDPGIQDFSRGNAPQHTAMSALWRVACPCAIAHWLGSSRG
jgi:hypothetical protein